MTNIFPKRHNKESILLSDNLPLSLRAQIAFLILFTEKVSTEITGTSFNMMKLRRTETVI